MMNIYVMLMIMLWYVNACLTPRGVTSVPAISQESKSILAHTHFSRLIGTPCTRTKALNWNELGYIHHDLEDLDAPFTEQEIEVVIKEMPSEKAPGPDSFIGSFYKHDLIEAIMSFYNHRTAKLGLMNSANIVLLPKTMDAASLSEYRPISLINSVSKIITKILANILAPHMNSLISNAQNAFIKKMCIHDNFIYAQRVIQLLHKKKRPALFIKLDISKAFDSLGWTFLLEVLENLGFSRKWRNWISVMLGTATSRVLINGQPSMEIRHARGLRQGDPLSPLLFILAIDPLQRIIEAAANKGVLKPVLPKAANLRCSLYADDAAIFADPNSLELEHLHKILTFFGDCSGLKINISKTEIFPIRLEDSAVSHLLLNFPGKIAKFPGRYLGLPLHIRKLRRVEVQPLIDKIGARLPGWKGRLLSTAGRETLVKTVLTSQPIYHMTVFPEQKWLIKRIDRLRRSFLWRGETPDKVYGGHSIINWPTTCLPKIKGGLGILDLERFARALRLRWLWFQWRQKERAWNKLELPCDSRDKDLFAASTTVTIGDGKTANFWTSSWAHGQTLKNIAPTLFKKAKRKNVTVHKALQDNKWIGHICPILTPVELQEYILIWNVVQQSQLNESREDNIVWRWTANGDYTTQSAYRIQFQGTYSKLKLTPIWKAKAEAKCRFFAWTLLHKKILTANNLIKRQWPNDPICKLCRIDHETPTHLCKDCDFTKHVWTLLKQWFGLTAINTVGTNGPLHNYWRKCRVKFDKTQRRTFDGVMIYFWWNIWKERNRRTFQNKSLRPEEVAFLCKDEVEQYKSATRTYVQTNQQQQQS
jgi:hypothetical protein